MKLKGTFSGINQKAGFITALSRELINTLVLNKENNKVKLAKILYNNLEKRHIQIYLHNNLVKEALGNLNWTGLSVFQVVSVIVIPTRWGWLRRTWS